MTAGSRYGKLLRCYKEFWCHKICHSYDMHFELGLFFRMWRMCVRCTANTWKIIPYWCEATDLTCSDMKVTACWDVKLYSLVDKYRYFRAMCCFLLANISTDYHTYMVSYPRRHYSKSLFIWHAWGTWYAYQ